MVVTVACFFLSFFLPFLVLSHGPRHSKSSPAIVIYRFVGFDLAKFIHVYNRFGFMTQKMS